MKVPQGKYNTRNMPQDFITSEQIREQINEYIHFLENDEIMQDEMNEIYVNFCDTVISEMD